MRVDVDSHFMEPLNWFEESFPKLAEKFPSYSPREFVYDFAVGDLLDAVPVDLHPAHPSDAMPALKPVFEFVPDNKEPRDGDPAHHLADPRLGRCDQDGIDVQFFNTNWGYMPYLKGVRLGRYDLAREGAWAFNTWATERVAGHSDRLIPVVVIDLDDVDWAIAELERTRAAGSRAFHLKAGPPNERRSLVHPDHERFWSACEDLGMAIVFHAGPQAASELHPGYFANGGDHEAYGLLHMAMSRPAQTALAAMILSGVFKRHPRLVLIIEELGVDWLPPLLSQLDKLAAGGALSLARYKQPLTPTEYVARQVRVAALASRDRVQDVIGLLPPDVVVFSSDYPHPEGTAEPVQIFESQLTEAGADAATRESFWGGSVAELLKL